MQQQSQKLKGFLEGCVLQILSEKSCYSQEIVSILQSKGFSTVTDGTLFPLLLRLEKEELFVIEKVPSSNGPSRKYYSLSEKGMKELEVFKSDWIEFCKIMNKILERNETNE